MSGKVRVGRCIYSRDGKRKDPEFDGFTKIIVLTKCTEYSSLSPYVLKDKKGRIMENIWQGSKVYENVPASVQRYSRYDPTVIWNHKAEKHAVKINETQWKILPAYFAWREKLMKCKYPVRYPVGFQFRHKCLFAFGEKNCDEIDTKPLNYIEARKAIYLPVYTRLVKEQPQFRELQSRLRGGENLLIVDVDGPHQESLGYYRETYAVDEKFIEKDTMLTTKDNLEIVLNDPKHPFGHGYCLAAALTKLF